MPCTGGRLRDHLRGHVFEALVGDVDQRQRRFEIGAARREVAERAATPGEHRGQCRSGEGDRGRVCGTSPETGWLNVTEVGVTPATVAPAAILAAARPACRRSHRVVETKGRVAPEGVSPLVGSDSGAATGASQVEISRELQQLAQIGDRTERRGAGRRDAIGQRPVRVDRLEAADRRCRAAPAARSPTAEA